MLLTPNYSIKLHLFFKFLGSPGSKCKSFAECAAQLFFSQNGETCIQSDGSEGACCKNILKNDGK